MVEQSTPPAGYGSSQAHRTEAIPSPSTLVEKKQTQRTDSDSESDASTIPDEPTPAERPNPLQVIRSRRSAYTTYEPYPGHADDEEDDDPTITSNDLEKAATRATTTSSRMVRVGTIGRRRRPEEGFSHPLAHTKTGPDVLVDFDGPDDPYRPLNWSFKKKAITTMVYGLITMGSSLSSSIYSPTVDVISEEFGVGTEVSLLGISLLLLGLGLGPLIWAPISEIYGRKAGVLYPYFIGAMFNFGAGAGKDIQTVLICRFFAGFFSAAPVTNTGGVLGDIWYPTQRGTAIVAYAMAVVGGPALGPIIGGALIVSDVSWRWTNYINGIYMCVLFFVGEIFLDESYAPVLLSQKAQHLRVATQNWALHARHEEWDPSFKEMVLKFGVRPFQMLMTPICLSVALYASFVYGLLYGNLAVFPIEFEQVRGWNSLVGSLPFLALLIGLFFGGAINILNNKFYISRWKAAGGVPIPEARLPPMMIGSIFFPAGVFLFAWTSGTNYHWILPNIGAALLGIGFLTIFQAALNYLIDTFQRYAASAVAANTFLRSVFALAFPLFIDPMFARLGIGWGMSVFGFFSVLLIPIPFVFYVWGPKIRKRGKYTANMG